MVLEKPDDKVTFQHQDIEFIEIVVGEEVPRIFILRADECLPQLEVNWIVLQPDLVRRDFTKGWEPVDERVGLFIGSEELTQIELRDSDPATLCIISNQGESAVSVQNFSSGPIELVATPRLPQRT